MLNVVRLSVVRLNAVMLSVVRLNVVMLSVVEPVKRFSSSSLTLRRNKLERFTLTKNIWPSLIFACGALCGPPLLR